MLKVYGVVPSHLLLAGRPLAEFPSISGGLAGGSIPVDCKVSLVELNSSALNDLAAWTWQPKNRGYLVVIEHTPTSQLKNHLRQIRFIKDEFGGLQTWPWFDPRYLRVALTRLPAESLARFYGPIRAFACESSGHIQVYQSTAGHLTVGSRCL